MDMATIGWVVLGWFTIAFVASLGLGKVLRQSHVTDDNLAVAASKRKVMRYMRVRSAKLACAQPSADTARANDSGRQSVKAAG